MNYMKSNKNGVKLLAAVAVFAMVFSGLFVVMSDVEGAKDNGPLTFSRADPIDYGGNYGTTSNKELNNSFSVSYDVDSRKYTFTGYLGQQVLTSKDNNSAFYKMWTDNTEYSYGIAFTATATAGTKITIGNGNEGTITSAGAEPCLLYIKEITKDSNVKVKIGSTDYTLDLTRLQTISSEDLAKKQIISGSGTDKVITLTKDAYITDPFTMGNVTINLNGYNLLAGCTVVSMGTSAAPVDANVTINAGTGGSITSTTNIVIAYSNGKLTVNDGTYNAPNGYAFVWYNGNTKVGTGATTEATIKDADISALVGVWISNNTIKKAVIEDCNIDSKRVGIYAGTVKDLRITNCNITSAEDDSAVEIKGGNAIITGGSIESNYYFKATGAVNTNGTGSGSAALNINNGYNSLVVDADATDKDMNVSVVGTQIVNTAGPSIQICAGYTVDGSQKQTTAVGGITFSIDQDVPMSEFSIVQVKADSDSSDNRKITVNVAESKKETLVVDTTALETNKNSGKILVLDGTGLNMESAVELTKGTTVMVDVPASATAKVNFKTDADSTVVLASTGTVNGTVDVDGMKLHLQNFKGNVVISKGSIIAKGDFTDGSITLENGNILKISGTISNDFTINGPNGEGQIATVIIEDGNTLSVGGDYTLSLVGNIKMNNDGELIGGGVIDVAEAAQFYTSNPVSVSFTGEGKIVLEDAIETLRLSDKLASSLTTEPTQKVIVTGNLTIKAGQTLTIQGDLEIPEGVIVTIEKGGKLIINGVTATANIAGTIKSAGSFEVKQTGTDGITITGTVSAEGEDSVNIDALTNLDGTISISTKGTATFIDNLNVSETGVVDVKGTITGNIYNKGTVNINGSVSAGTTVYMRSVDAVVDIQSLKSGILTVSDEGLYLKTVGTDKKTVPVSVADWEASTNSIKFTNVKGVKVTEGIVYETHNDIRNPYNYMYIAGAASVADSKNTTNNEAAIVIATGKVTVADEFSFSKLALEVTATMSVTGTVLMGDDEDASFTGTGNLVVTGLVKTVDYEVDTQITHVSAVKYEKRVDTKTEYYYTNLADAIASGVSELEVLGDIVISKDTTIPAGVSIDANNVTVENKVTFTVADGGYLDFTTVTVDGTFSIENTDTGVNRMTGILSDTSVITEKTAMYTNLVNALANAESGKVEITKTGDGIVILSEDATINENVTLVIPSSKTLKIRNGVTLTVAGTLDNKGIIGSEKIANAPAGVCDNGFGPAVKNADATGTEADKLYSVIKVTGTIVSASSMVYGTEFTTTGYSIPGAYYQAKAKYYITTIENAAKAIQSADDCKVDIYGENKVGTVAFEGTASTPVTVDVKNGKLTAESMTVRFGTMTFENGVQIDGTFGSAVGTVTVSNMKADSNKFTIFDSVVTIDEKDVQKVVMTGKIVQNDVKVKSTVDFDGAVEAPMTIGALAVTGSAVTIPEGATVTVSGSAETLEVLDDVLKINGTVIVNDNGKLKAITVVVLGTLDIQAKTDKIAAGQIEVNNLYIGGTTASVKPVDISTSTGAAASVNAPESGVKVVYLFPGSTVTGGLKTVMDKEGTKYTEFYVEDALWMTVFDIGNTGVKIVETNTTTEYNFEPALKEKKFVAWQTKSTSGLNNLGGTKAIGDVKAVYAKIDYKVYDVKVQVADGIDDVYIDGVLMGKGTSGTLTFEAKVDAGQHTISYTLSNGYGGEAVMYINGDKTTGYTFTASGSFGSDTEYNIILQGVEKTGYTPDSPDNNGSSDNGMSITDYLLIVLVVLIVIMAVLVAIRMMRS